MTRRPHLTRFLLTKIGCGVLLFGCLGALQAADEQQLALALRAQSDFDRVEQASVPALPDIARCEQTEAAWLTVAPAAELTVIHFRKGYCSLASAVITGRSDDFLRAASEFDDAIKAWPERVVRAPRSQAPEPLPTTLGLLAVISRLDAVPSGSTNDAEFDRAPGEISAALGHPACSAALMPPSTCSALFNTGRLWLGWIELKRDDLDQATRAFSGLAEFGWPQWAAAKRAFRDRQYGQAAAQFGQAVGIWSHWPDPAASLPARLAPRPDRAQALTDWGGAQLLSGDVAAAIATLDAAVKAAPASSRALFLRARAEELAGRADSAIADYGLASRTALAHAEDLASGEAHLYRGILLYRRKDFEHAENEFASALNFEIPAALRPDAIAWRHMASVAEGACSTSRAALEESLADVSPYFPKSEARALASTCPLSGVSSAAI